MFIGGYLVLFPSNSIIRWFTIFQYNKPPTKRKTPPKISTNTEIKIFATKG